MPVRQHSTPFIDSGDTSHSPSFLCPLHGLHLPSQTLCTKQLPNMSALTLSHAQVQHAVPAAFRKQPAAVRLRPCTVPQLRQSTALRQQRQQFTCRASVQRQDVQQPDISFDREDASIVDVNPNSIVDVEMVSAAQQEQEQQLQHKCQRPAWWALGQRLAKGAAVFAMAMALVRSRISCRR